MSIRGHRHSAETLGMRVQGSGATLTEALEDAVGVALLAIPEAREVNISEYTFEVESGAFSTISDPMPTRSILRVVAEVDLYVELRKAVRESRAADD